MSIKRLSTWLVLFTALLFTASCKQGDIEQTQEGEADMAIQLTSKAFKEGESIPKQYTCDGKNTSPQLAWTGTPGVAKSFALIMDDPDAPGGTFVHWVLFDLPAEMTELAEGYQGLGSPGSNSYRKQAYNGPCPPPGAAHRYYFKLYALDTNLKLPTGATKADVEKAMQGHILAWGQLMGKYRR